MYSNSQVRAKTTAGYGPFSASRRVTTTSRRDVAAIDHESEAAPTQGVNVPVIAVVVGGGIVFLLIVGVALYCLRYAEFKNKQKIANG